MMDAGEVGGLAPHSARVYTRGEAVARADRERVRSAAPISAAPPAMTAARAISSRRPRADVSGIAEDSLGLKWIPLPTR
jgi:hypothetical protein